MCSGPVYFAIPLAHGNNRVTNVFCCTWISISAPPSTPVRQVGGKTEYTPLCPHFSLCIPLSLALWTLSLPILKPLLIHSPHIFALSLTCVCLSQCLWCQKTELCITYPVKTILPPHALCPLNDARWGRCWGKKHTHTHTSAGVGTNVDCVCVSELPVIDHRHGGGGWSHYHRLPGLPLLLLQVWTHRV